MPYNSKYNRMIADEMDRINQNKADYMAYSNQVFMNGNKFVGADDLPKLPEGLKPKYAKQRNPVNTDGGITHKNGEGYSAGMKFGSKFGEDINRNKHAFTPKRLRCESSSDSEHGGGHNSESESESESESGSSSSSEEEEYDESDVPSLEDLLVHLAGLKMDKKTHDDVVCYLHKMEGAGKGLSGRGSVWGWIKDKANKVADVAKKGYEFAEKNIKPIAKIVVPLLKLHPGIATAIEKGKSIASAIPLVGSETKKKLEEYGLGKSGGAKRAPSKWVMHCKAFAKEHKMKYGEAMKSPECKASYKKSGSGVSQAMAVDPLPQSVLTDVVQIGKGKSGGKRKVKYIQRIPAANGEQFLDTNQNEMVGVPARAPGYMKSTGIHFEGASLGAGVMGGPSNDLVNKGKITGMGLKEDIDAAEAAAKSAVKGKGKLKDLVIKTAASALAKKYKLKPAAAVAPVPAPVAAPAAPEVGGKKRGKTGSALFKQKGQYPIELKQSEPLSADMLRKTDYEPTDEAKVLKAGAKKPRAASAWVSHVKAYAKEHGISYKAAMSAAKPSYKK
jgi:hypothetical protein